MPRAGPAASASATGTWWRPTRRSSPWPTSQTSSAPCAANWYRCCTCPAAQAPATWPTSPCSATPGRFATRDHCWNGSRQPSSASTSTSANCWSSPHQSSPPTPPPTHPATPRSHPPPPPGNNRQPVPDNDLGDTPPDEPPQRPDDPRDGRPPPALFRLPAGGASSALPPRPLVQLVRSGLGQG